MWFIFFYMFFLIYNIFNEILSIFMGEYAIVEFTDTNEVELVPMSWITSDGKECYGLILDLLQSKKMAGMLPNSTDFKTFLVNIMYQTSKLNYNYEITK